MAIGKSKKSKNLERLFLDSTYLTAAGVKALAESPHLRKLKELDLSRCIAKDEVMAALAISKNFSNLEILKLDSDMIGAAGVEALARSEYGGRRLA